MNIHVHLWIYIILFKKKTTFTCYYKFFYSKKKTLQEKINSDAKQTVVTVSEIDSRCANRLINYFWRSWIWSAVSSRPIKSNRGSNGSLLPLLFLPFKRIKLRNTLAPLQFPALRIESADGAQKMRVPSGRTLLKRMQLAPRTPFFIRKRNFPSGERQWERFLFPPFTAAVEALTDKLRSESSIVVVTRRRNDVKLAIVQISYCYLLFVAR